MSPTSATLFKLKESPAPRSPVHGPSAGELVVTKERLTQIWSQFAYQDVSTQIDMVPLEGFPGGDVRMPALHPKAKIIFDSSMIDQVILFLHGADPIKLTPRVVFSATEGEQPKSQLTLYRYGVKIRVILPILFPTTSGKLLISNLGHPLVMISYIYLSAVYALAFGSQLRKHLIKSLLAYMITGIPQSSIPMTPITLGAFTKFDTQVVQSSILEGVQASCCYHATVDAGHYDHIFKTAPEIEHNSIIITGSVPTRLKYLKPAPSRFVLEAKIQSSMYADNEGIIQILVCFVPKAAVSNLIRWSMDQWQEIVDSHTANHPLARILSGSMSCVLIPVAVMMMAAEIIEWKPSFLESVDGPPMGDGCLLVASECRKPLSVIQGETPSQPVEHGFLFGFKPQDSRAAAEIGVTIFGDSQLNTTLEHEVLVFEVIDDLSDNHHKQRALLVYSAVHKHKLKIEVALPGGTNYFVICVIPRHSSPSTRIVVSHLASAGSVYMLEDSSASAQIKPLNVTTYLPLKDITLHQAAASCMSNVYPSVYLTIHVNGTVQRTVCFVYNGSSFAAITAPVLALPQGDQDRVELSLHTSETYHPRAVLCKSREFHICWRKGSTMEPLIRNTETRVMASLPKASIGNPA